MHPHRLKLLGSNLKVLMFLFFVDRKPTGPSRGILLNMCIPVNYLCCVIILANLLKSETKIKPTKKRHDLPLGKLCISTSFSEFSFEISSFTVSSAICSSSDPTYFVTTVGFLHRQKKNIFSQKVQTAIQVSFASKTPYEL